MIEAETKNCQNCKQNFQIESEDLTFYEQMKVPPPTFCWLCRAQRRLTYRNERGLHKRKSDLSGKEIFSVFPADVEFPVYDVEEWYSDAWDPMDSGMEVDFSRPFMEQFQELAMKTARPARGILRLVNSDYSNNASNLKNCYLIFNSNTDEDCAYGNANDQSKNCIDNSHINTCELAYENFWLTRCSRIFFSSQCEDSTDVYFSKNLRGCNDCFGSINLRGKRYCIFNQQYSKEEYQEKVKEFDFGSYQGLQEILKITRKFWRQFPSKFAEGTKNEDVSGAYISHSKNVKKSYLVREGKDLKYCQYLQVPKNEGCYDHSIWGFNNNFTYECVVCGEGNNNIRFCSECYISNKNLEYCHWCQSSSDLFGCFSLRKKQYCILNKQYSREDFEKLRTKIIQHMTDMPYVDKARRNYKYGEFFPIEMSPFAYNESISSEQFPMTKAEVIAEGWRWREPEDRGYTVTQDQAELPDHIRDADEEIIKEVIGCAHRNVEAGDCGHGCTKAFKIIPMELQFYKKFNIALPRLCPNCRHHERIKQRSSIRLYIRKCQCRGENSDGGAYQNTAEHFHGGEPCPNEFQTSYSPDRAEIIYCEQCYNAEVV